MNIQLAKLGNLLYKVCPAAYRPVYGLYKRWTDRKERELLTEITKPGMTVLDAGANIGIYTQFLASLVGASGRVVAFEPEPHNFALLQRAVAGLPQVTAVRAAVGETDGTVRLFVADDLNVDHHSNDDGEGRRTIEVPAITLDAYLKPGERVDLIKMDIQGAELAALRGAERVLGENPKIRLLLEFWPYGLTRAGSSPDALLRHLEHRGFRYRAISNASLDSARRDESHYANLIAERN